MQKENRSDDKVHADVRQSMRGLIKLFFFLKYENLNNTVPYGYHSSTNKIFYSSSRDG